MQLSRQCVNALILLAPLTACGGSPSEVAAPKPAHVVHYPPGSPVLPFGAGMTRPERISGDDPRPSKEAVAAGARGLVVIQCVVRTSGEVTDCRFVKSIALLDQAVLDAIKTWRVKPAYFRGKPVNVDYTFLIRVGSW
jgi:TonB family protein